MNNRMRTLIDALEIKKVDFARKLNISQSFVSDMCSGKSKPSNRTITDICREFKVSEEWLRTGKGEMFVPEPAFDLSEYANRHGMTALETEILKAYLELDPNTRESLLRHFKERLTSSAPGGYFQNGNNHSRPARWYGHPCPHRLRDRGPRRSGGVLPGNP